MLMPKINWIPFDKNMGPTDFTSCTEYLHLPYNLKEEVEDPTLKARKKLRKSFGLQGEE